MKLTANGYGCAACGHDKALHLRRCMGCDCPAGYVPWLMRRLRSILMRRKVPHITQLTIPGSHGTWPRRVNVRWEGWRRWYLAVTLRTRQVIVWGSAAEAPNAHRSAPPPYRSVRFVIFSTRYPCKQWRVLSEDGTAYAVGVWKNGDWHPGSIVRAWRESRSLRRQEPRARVVRR